MATRAGPDLISVTHPGGIYLPEPDLWLDPPFPVERAFISHAHADHVSRHRQTLASALTAELMETRFSASTAFERLPMGEAVERDGWRHELLPAGHVVGSAMLHLTRLRDGATLLYTGDYKLRQGLTAEKCALREADTLIMETTFGLPHYCFPPVADVVQQVLHWVQEVAGDGDIPVLLGYSLGKAQEILAALTPLGLPVMVHPSILELTEQLRPHLGTLPEIRLFEPATAKGHVLVFPPNAARSQALRRLKRCRLAMLSGWALHAGAKYRYQVEAVFPWSDHADYPELLETVKEVAPRRVYLVHGAIREFAADLRRRGIDAWALGVTDQLELGLEAEPRVSEAEVAVESNEPEHEVAAFGRWVSACETTAGEASRIKKRQVLAEYFRTLSQPEDVERAVRWSAAMVFDPADHGGPMNVGWALIKRVLMDLTGVSEAEYRVVSRTQADAARTAYLLLQKRSLVEAEAVLTLGALDEALRAVRTQRGGMQKAQLLADLLRPLSAREGSWVVRLLLGDLRMGFREGLVDEAIAEAFCQELEAVREATMLGGDPGAAAVLAMEGRLGAVVPRPFVPVKAMLASPEESADGIWDRLGAKGSIWLEDKFDGIRAQVHRVGDRVAIYSRDLKLVTESFPELVTAARQLNADGIFDGEIIAHADEHRLSFFDLQKRLGRRDQGDLFVPSEVTVQFVAFDALWVNGEALLKQPLQERRRALEAVCWPTGMRCIGIQRAESAEAIEEAFWEARRRQNEGLIAKDAESLYSPGRRGKGWLKLKKAFSTLDVVVVKAQQGHGKRSHVLSDYTFAVLDEASGELKVLGKAYSGLTDVEIERLTEHFTANTLSQKGRVRTVQPTVVLEVAFDSIQPSSRHNSGLSLRFPRIKAIRHDKTAADIDTLGYARRLAGVSE